MINLLILHMKTGSLAIHSLLMALNYNFTSIIQRLKDYFLTCIIDENSANHRYKIKKYLYRDLTGTTFLVRCESTNKYFICKRYEKNVKHTNKYFTTMLQSEYCIASNLDHINIIKFYDMLKYKNKWFALIEYAGERSLYDKCGEGMTIYELEIYFKQLIDGLSYMHNKGITHRNLRLESLVITNDNVLKISDFSAAEAFVVIHMYEKRRSRGKVGLRPYMAPEMHTQESYDGEAADIWSCGVILYAMIFSHFPFRDSNVKCATYRRFLQSLQAEDSHLSRLPYEIYSLLIGMLEPNPEKRIRIAKIKNNQWFKLIKDRHHNITHVLPE